jgi:hypothetical protein
MFAVEPIAHEVHAQASTLGGRRTRSVLRMRNMGALSMARSNPPVFAHDIADRRRKPFVAALEALRRHLFHVGEQPRAHKITESKLWNSFTPAAWRVLVTTGSYFPALFKPFACGRSRFGRCPICSRAALCSQMSHLCMRLCNSIYL